jgi:hypothetical protein
MLQVVLVVLNPIIDGTVQYYPLCNINLVLKVQCSFELQNIQCSIGVELNLPFAVLKRDYVVSYGNTIKQCSIDKVLTWYGLRLCSIYYLCGIHRCNFGVLMRMIAMCSDEK